RRGSRPPLRSSWARDIETARASSLLTADTVEVEARTNDHRGLSHIWEIDFFWIDAQLLVYVKKLRPNRVGSATDEATAVPLSRSENGERGRRAARQSRKRQAAGGRAVADAHAQHAVRAAGPHELSQPRGRAVLYSRGQGHARNRRHDAPARPRIFRCGARTLADHARSFAADRTPADAQPRHDRRLALPSRSGGGTGLARDRI